jgi:hypothetical protein
VLVRGTVADGVSGVAGDPRPQTSVFSSTLAFLLSYFVFPALPTFYFLIQVRAVGFALIDWQQ